MYTNAFYFLSPFLSNYYPPPHAYLIHLYRSCLCRSLSGLTPCLFPPLSGIPFQQPDNPSHYQRKTRTYASSQFYRKIPHQGRETSLVFAENWKGILTSLLQDHNGFTVTSVLRFINQLANWIANVMHHISFFFNKRKILKISIAKADSWTL